MKKLFFTLLTMAACSLAAWELDFTDSGKKLPPGFTICGSGTKLTPEGLENVSLSAKESSGLAAEKKQTGFSPDGAFELEIEFKLLPELLKKRPQGKYFLWDNKYSMAADAPPGPKHCGFMVYLERTGTKNFQCTALLGLEEKQSVRFSIPCPDAGDGKYHKILLKFDPSGQQTLAWDGAEQTMNTPAGKIGKARIPVRIGNRFGALFSPLGGIIRRISLRPCEALKFSPVSRIQKKYGSRRVFTRCEKNGSITAEFSNMTEKKLTGKVRCSLRKQDILTESPFSVEARRKGFVTFPVETNLMPGKYEEELLFTDPAGKELGRGIVNFTIVPELTDFLPMIAGDRFQDGADMDLIRRIGFTHAHNVIAPRGGRVTEELKNRVVEDLDLHLEHGLLCDENTKLKTAFKNRPQCQRVDRSGKLYPRFSVDAAHPEVYQYAVGTLEETARAVGSHPAWDMICTNGESRDSSAISFSENTRKNLKTATGLDIPDDVSGRLPVDFSSNLNMPWNCVVSTQSRDFRFWNWFWKQGDGWDKLNGDQARRTSEIIKRKRFLSYFAPATRALPYLGIAGDVALVSTWTYCYPDPLNIGQTTDELLALADGKRLAGISNQGIWYRSRVAPQKQKVKNPPAWVAEHQNAQYISPAPDLLLEGYWIAAMRKVALLATHGQGSWLRHIEGNAYHFTNPQVTDAYRKFNREVREPLGPALKHVDEVTPEVMILESFTNALYGGEHTWGWGNNWPACLHMALQWAHIQPGVCYEEQLLRGDLDDGKVKVLFLPSLSVLSDELLAKLKDLQKKGIFLVGDEKLNIALMPDLRIPSYRRDPADARKSKKELQKCGKELREKLKDILSPCLRSDTQDLILRRRVSGEVHYLFAVNDSRKYGNYVGQWKRVMEEGIPLAGAFYAALPAGAAYDLVRHTAVPFRKKDGKLEFSMALEPGSGKIIALFPRHVGMVQLTAPETLKPGEDFSIQVSIADKAGKKFKAVLPLELRLEHGKTVLPGSGFYATDRSGNFVLNDTAALNLPKGKAVLRVRCLSSGLETTREITVR